MSDQEQQFTCGHSRAELASMGAARWGIPVVSYFIQTYPAGLGMSKGDVDAVFAQAFASWEAVCGLKFKVASGPNDANILIGTGRGRRAGFDGPMGILAFCYLPSGDNFAGQLNMLLDLDEAWTDDPAKNGILMLNTVAHELGHGLGLDHTNVQRQLMNPVYSAAIATPQSHDRQEVVDRYGPPVAAPVTPQPIPPTTGGRFVDILLKDESGTVWSGKLTPKATQNLEL